MVKKTCYVVLKENPEGSTLCHVCLSEETAKRMFEEVKRSMIKDVEDRISYVLTRGRDSTAEQRELEIIKQFRYPRGVVDVEIESGDCWIWDNLIVREVDLLE